MLEQRALYDADLIKDGARFDERARLVLTQLQLERTHQTGDALGRVSLESADVELTSEELLTRERFDTWLARPLADGYDQRGVKFSLTTRTVNQLELRKIRTRRDILILGQNGVRDVLNIGDKAVAELDEMIKAGNEFGIEWKQRPGYRDIAWLSTDLSQVPGYILKCRGDLLNNTAPFSHYPYTTPDSVQTSLDDRGVMDVEGWNAQDADRFRSFKRREYIAAREFEEKYLNAKRQLEAERTLRR